MVNAMVSLFYESLIVKTRYLAYFILIVGKPNVFSLREISLRIPFAVRLRSSDIFSNLFFDIVHLNGNAGNSSSSRE